MSDQIIQLVRTIVQAAWGAVFGLTVVQQFLDEAGLDPEWAEGVAVTLSIGLVVFISQRLEHWGPFGRVVGTLLNGINRAPAYQPPDQLR